MISPCWGYTGSGFFSFTIDTAWVDRNQSADYSKMQDPLEISQDQNKSTLKPKAIVCELQCLQW